MRVDAKSRSSRIESELAIQSDHRRVKETSAKSLFVCQLTLAPSVLLQEQRERRGGHPQASGGFDQVRWRRTNVDCYLRHAAGSREAGTIRGFKVRVTRVVSWTRLLRLNIY